MNKKENLTPQNNSKQMQQSTTHLIQTTHEVKKETVVSIDFCYSALAMVVLVDNHVSII